MNLHREEGIVGEDRKENYVRANHSINGKGKLQYLTKLFIL